MTKFSTPIGRFVWPKLTTPDCYREPGQAADPDKDKYYYSTKVVFDPEDDKFVAFKAKLDKMAKDAAAEEVARTGKKNPKFVDPLYSLKDEEDKEGNLTGNVVMSFRAMSHGVKNGRKWSRTVPLVDHEAQPFDCGDQDLGNGTLGRISFELRGYTSSGKIGVSLQLRSAMIVVPKFFSKQGADDDFADDTVSPEDFAEIAETHGGDGDF